MNFKETFVRREKSVKGKAVGFNVDVVKLPNGKLAHREYLDHPGAVAVVAVKKDQRIVMVRQYRYPVGEITLEIPAGKLSKGEKPATCVERELAEETGYRAGRIKKILSYWPTAAFANEVIHIFVAFDLKPGPVNPDDDEFLGTEEIPLNTLLRQIKSGKIKDSKTMIALLAYSAFVRRRSRG